jgi:hypothetical protein
MRRVILPLALGLVLAAEAPAPANGTAPDLEIVARSLRPDQRERVDKAVGGLASLPIYRMEFVVDPAGHTVTGQEQIVVAAGSAPLGEVFLRTYENASFYGRDPVITVTDVRLDGKSVTTDAPNPTVTHIPISPVLTAGATASIDLLFRVEVPAISDSADNLDASMFAALQMAQGTTPAGPAGDHGVLGASSSVMNLGAFFPVLATRHGNFFDTEEPSNIGDIPWTDPSNFIVSIVVPAGYRAVGTGVEIGRTPIEGQQTRTTLVAAAVRDFAAFISKDYTEETATAGGVTIHAYALKSDAVEGKKVLETARHAFEFYQDHFGPYPWAEFKVAEASLKDSAGGVEYPTIVSVASMLYRTKQSQMVGMIPLPGGSSVFFDVLLEGAVSHEVAHQWWSAIVGNDPQRHPFIDEPLAQYSSALYVESRRGKKAYDQFTKTQFGSAYKVYRMHGGADAKVERPSAEFPNEREYGAMIYGKAPGFYGAARKLLGDKAFFDSLRRYATDHYLGMAQPDDFLAAAGKVAPAKSTALGALRQRWFRELHGDDDIGKGDLSSLLGDISSSGQPLDPASQQALKQLEPILRQIMQNGQLPQGFPGAPAPGASPP